MGTNAISSSTSKLATSISMLFKAATFFLVFFFFSLGFWEGGGGEKEFTRFISF